LSADDELIRRAREKAGREARTLNAVFRHWLERYVRSETAVQEYERLMAQLDHVESGGALDRDTMNAR
jgi:hypothetical protein